MDYTKLGKNQLEFSKMALGTWAFAGGTLWGASDDALALKTVHAALDVGVTVMDTAEKYGNGKSEEVLGKALKDRRHGAIVCTKVYTDHLHYDTLIQCCEESLRRLQTDYIDLYQIHWPAPNMPIDEALEAFARLKRDGKIREIGICNAGVGCIDALKDSDMVTNQMPYSLLWRIIEGNGILERTTQAGMKTWAYSPLAQGLLTGKFSTIEQVPMGRRGTRMYNGAWGQGRHTDGGFESEIFALLAQLRIVMAETGLSMSALAMGFLKAQDHVSSVLVGARSPEQLQQNVEAFQTIIAQEVIERIDALSRPLHQAMGVNADLYENANGGRVF